LVPNLWVTGREKCAQVPRFRDSVRLELTLASAAESTSIENRVEDGIEATGILSVSGKKVATGRIEHTIPFLFGVETTDVGIDTSSRR